MNSKLKNNREKLLIIGPLPPPIGGVGVFLERYIEKEKENYNIQILDYSKLNNARKLFALARIGFQPFSGRIFVNHINTLLFLFLLIRPFKNMLIYYDHNFRFMESLGKTSQKIFKAFISKTNEIHIVNDSIIDYFAGYGVDIKAKTKLKIPFLPPILDQETDITQSYPTIVKEILNSKNTIIAANAFRLEKYQNIDLYGADLCVEICRKLKAEINNIKLVFFVSKIENPYHNTIIDKIKEYDLSDYFILVEGNYQFWPMIKHCDIFIRPTSTDGDAISIREAIYFKKPVITSDVVARPEGVKLFRNRDVNDLYQKILDVLAKQNK